MQFCDHFSVHIFTHNALYISKRLIPIPLLIYNKKLVRHGPFDIGGCLGFWSGPRYYFQTKSEQDYFFRQPKDGLFFGFWHLKHADKWVLGNYWRQIIFFPVPLSKIIFFSQNQSKEIFFRKKTQAPPPEYQMDRA